MNIALFPGSFDPFTIGHADIVRRALPLFDEIVIAVGINSAKQPMFPTEDRVETIRRAFANQPKVKVATYSCLTVDFAREVGATHILRGVRTVQDFEYERQMADANRELSGIETVLLYSSPAYAHISSSLVRDLHRFGHDITPYLA